MKPEPTVREAGEDDVPAIMAILHSAARGLTYHFGKGPWSREATEKGTRFSLAHSRAFLAELGGMPVGTFRLTKRKPWAIDPSYFSPASRPIYLMDMAVSNEAQRKGLGRAMLARAMLVAQSWPADFIRLDAYDAEAGASEFYRRCGYASCGGKKYRGTALLYYEVPVTTITNLGARK